MVVLASAGGNTGPAIASLAQADEDTIRQVIHRFDEMGMAGLDPSEGGRPFTRWGFRRLADYLSSQAPARSPSGGT